MPANSLRSKFPADWPVGKRRLPWTPGKLEWKEVDEGDEVRSLVVAATSWITTGSENTS
jgi:hypothetical protein